MPKKSMQDSPEPQISNPYKKLIIFSMGGKGGIGKTTLISSMVEFFEAEKIPILALDLDAENETKGGMQSIIKNAIKVNVQRPDGLDVFIGVLDREEAIVVADMGAGQGQVTSRWFDTIFDEMHEAGVGFLAVGLVTPDPASVTSVLQWAIALQDRVRYLIVRNEAADPGAKFSYWDDSPKAREFCELFRPAVMTMESRSTKLQGHLTNYGLTLGQVADRRTGVDEMTKSEYVLKAQRYRRILFGEFRRTIVPLLPDL